MKSKIIKSIIAIIMLGLSLMCYKYVSDMNIVPNKYLNLFIAIILIVNVIAIILLFIKGIVTKIFSSILYVILSVISIIGIKYSINTINYLNKGFSNSEDITTYNVIVLNKSRHEKLEDLKNTTMGYLSIDIDNDEYITNIKEKVNIDLEEYNLYELYKSLIDKKIESMLINEAYLDLLEEQYEDLDSKIKIIYSFDIEKEKEQKEEKIEKLESVNIYLSGSDSRSGYISTSSRSDVNMIVTVNPNTHTILLTNIPRDYYVQLHGTSGLRDKLTHAGIYGINMSKQTLEDLFGTKIDYSVKVGFRSVIEMIDLVGGIDINSDTAFYSHCGDGGAERVNVKLGMNHFTGPQALSYARERYAYLEGDRHRGENQQQVIEATFTKLISDKGLLLKYDTLLNSFSELYRTDIPKDLITLLIKNQLDKMPSWTMLKQSVTGYDSSNQTYSMPGVMLYVMEPDRTSVNNAIAKIQEVYDGN